MYFSWEIGERQVRDWGEKAETGVKKPEKRTKIRKRICGFDVKFFIVKMYLIGGFLSIRRKKNTLLNLVFYCNYNNMSLIKKSKILVVDDEMANRLLLHGILGPHGYEIFEASNGEEALEMVEKIKPDLVLLDVVMPKKNGFEVCQALKSSNKTKLIPVVMLTSLDQLQDKLRGVDLGADDYINKPFNLAELTTRVKALLSLKHYTDELEYVHDVLTSIANIVESRDYYTHNHCKNVVKYSVAIAKMMNVSEEDIEMIRLGADFHDIGKIAIPDAILLKPGKLTPEEFEVMKTHAAIGAELLKPMKTMEKVLPLIRNHHEKLDGSGYPDGWKNDEIFLPIRILSVVDIYEALISKRTYKDSMPPEKAFGILKEEADKGWWDIRVIENLMAVISQDSF